MSQKDSMYSMLNDTVTTSLGKDVGVFSQWLGEVREKREIPLKKKVIDLKSASNFHLRTNV